jgi:ribonuclease R
MILKDPAKKFSWKTPKEQDIVAMLKRFRSPLRIVDLFMHFEAKQPEHDTKITELVDRLVMEGKLKYVRDSRIALSSFRSPIQEFAVVKITPDGVILAKSWEDAEGDECHQVKIPHQLAGKLDIGTRFIGKIEDLAFKRSYSHVDFIRLADTHERTTIGTFERAGEGGRLVPIHKGEYPFAMDVSLCDGLEHGDIVVFYHGLKPYVERLGQLNDPKALAMISIIEHKINLEFPEPVLEECAHLPAIDENTCKDLRDLELITIDGPHAKDFDDAVYAEPHEEGWRLVVAIADVAHYVPVGSALDREAFKRGNSVYFPGFVVPMLPEALSNGVCSLMPQVDRACVVADMLINEDGKLLSYTFYRGVMHSKARTTYAQIQSIIDEPNPAEPLSPLVQNLYGAFNVLAKARAKRGTLELELPEREAVFNETGMFDRIDTSVSLQSHKLIEEFMILANVACATFLEEKLQPFLYRVHDSPPAKKVAEFEKNVRPFYPGPVKANKKFFTQFLAHHADSPLKATAHEMMLRTQAQATYTPVNIGHFGLALRRYAHFTSPIRRYADLIAHRSIVAALGLSQESACLYDLEAAGQHISATERVAATAERESLDRLAALFLMEHKSETFPARITGMHRAGIFVRLTTCHIEGLIPFRDLGEDMFLLDDETQQIIGKRTRVVFTLGDIVTVNISRLDPIAGHVDFVLVDHTPQCEAPKGHQARSSSNHTTHRKGTHQGSFRTKPGTEGDRGGSREGAPRKPYTPREGGSSEDRPRRPYTPREGGSSEDRPRRPYTPREGGSSDRPARAPWTPRAGETSADRPRSPARKPWAPREGGSSEDRPRRPYTPREGGSSENRPRRPYTPREGGSSEDRPRRPYTPREGGSSEDCPRRPYTPREGGSSEDRPRRPYTPREGGSSEDRPRRPYTPREGGSSDRPARKPYTPREGGSSEDRPRRPYTPREGGSSEDRPRRPYTPREGGSSDRPARKPYTPREGGSSEDRPRRPYTPREGGSSDRPARKPYTPREGGSSDRPARKPYTPREGGSSEDRPRRPYTPREGGSSDRPEKRPYKKD